MYVSVWLSAFHFFLSVSLCASICNSDVSLGVREYIGLSVCLYVCVFLDMYDWISQCTEYAYATFLNSKFSTSISTILTISTFDFSNFDFHFLLQ